MIAIHGSGRLPLPLGPRFQHPINLVACTPAKNEDWCLPFTARVTLQWVDTLVVLDDGSTDETPQVLSDLQTEFGRDRVKVLPQTSRDGRWNDMYNRQALLEEARRLKATYIAIVDADELLTHNLFPLVRNWVEQTPDHQHLQVPLLNLWESMHAYRTDGSFRQWLTLAFRDRLNYHWAAREGGYQFHHRQPMPLGPEGWRPTKEGGAFHLQFVRRNALRAKQAYYKMVEVLWGWAKSIEGTDRKYSWWTVSPATVKEVPPEWLAGYETILPYLDLSDNGSWYAQECSRMWNEHPGKFDGLDLFGVTEQCSPSRV